MCLTHRSPTFSNGWHPFSLIIVSWHTKKVTDQNLSKKVTDQDSPRYVLIIGRQMSPIGSIFWGFRRHTLVISVIFMLNFCNSVTFCTFFHVKISKVHYLSLKFLVISKVPFLSLFSLKRRGTPDLGLWHTSVPWHTGWQPMYWTRSENQLIDFFFGRNFVNGRLSQKNHSVI